MFISSPLSLARLVLVHKPTLTLVQFLDVFLSSLPRPYLDRRSRRCWRGRSGPEAYLVPLMQPPPDMCTNRVRAAAGLWSQDGSHSHTLRLYGLSETAGWNNFQQAWPLLFTDPAAGPTTPFHCLPPVHHAGMKPGTGRSTNDGSPTSSAHDMQRQLSIPASEPSRHSPGGGSFASIMQSGGAAPLLISQSSMKRLPPIAPVGPEQVCPSPIPGKHAVNQRTANDLDR